MRSIIYVSTALTGFDEAELDRLAQSAARFNAAHGITGVLTYNGLNFMQAIEGASADLDACMARIVADERHHGIVTVRDHAIEQREFPDWSMRSQLIVNRAPDTPAQLMAGILEQAAQETQKLFTGFSTLRAG